MLRRALGALLARFAAAGEVEHIEVDVGDEVVLSVPSGDVVMSYTVQSGSQRRVMLLHADNSASTFALREQIQSDLAELPDASMITWFVELSGPTQTVENELVGFMDVSTIDLPAGAEYYLCGPLVFMQAVRSALIARGIPAKDIQYEVFGPGLWLANFK